MRRFLLAVAVLAVALPLFATEPNPSPRQRQVIEKMLEVMNIDRNITNVMDAMFERIQKQFLDDAEAKGNDPDDLAEAKEMFTMFRQRAAKINFGGDLHDAYVRMYAKYFTEKELEDLLNFYSSPTGRKVMDTLPQITADSMQLGMDKLGPKLEQVMGEVREEQEKKRPWRRTMADMRTIATAVEAYATDQDEYPSGDFAGLESKLVPTYLTKLPKKDMWGHEYAYAVSDDHKHYRIVSAGADTIFEWDSRRIVLPKEEGAEPQTSYRDRLEDDLIYADGQFLQLPAQAKPKTKE